MISLTLLTGPLGSGITSAKYIFEELGYNIVHNPPLESIDSLLDIFLSEKYQNVKTCIIVPVKEAKEVIKSINANKNINFTFLLLNANKKELMKRYKLSRHIHPLMISRNMSLESSIEEDLKDVREVQNEADIHIDTSSLSIKQLRQLLLFKMTSKEKNNIVIQFTSFGIKNGIPSDIDTLIDARNIPNPYWVEELRNLTGFDKPVIDYINSFPITKDVINNIINYLEFSLKTIAESSRASYNVGIACTGGQHRSPYIANILEKHFKDKYNVLVIHRDLKG